MSAPVIHLADAPARDIGIQRCIRCGTVLTDTRFVVVPEGAEPALFWPTMKPITVNGSTAFVGEHPAGAECEPSAWSPKES